MSRPYHGAGATGSGTDFPVARSLLLLWASVAMLSGAFEGANLFRTTTAPLDGIFPPAMNNPARLPDQPLWASLGQGRPMGYAWAAYSAVSFGGRYGPWRSAAGIWTSGDELYSETSFTTAVAKQAGQRVTAGLSLSYNKVSIKGFDAGAGEYVAGLAIITPLSESIDFSVWYGGQPLKRSQAYKSLTRQLVQIGLSARRSGGFAGTLAVEKTPGFPLSLLAEVNLTAWGGMDLELGYRTGPGLPYAGARLALRRLLLSVRMNYHPIFGFSSAFGFAFR